MIKYLIKNTTTDRKSQLFSGVDAKPTNLYLKSQNKPKIYGCRSNSSCMSFTSEKHTLEPLSQIVLKKNISCINKTPEPIKQKEKLEIRGNNNDFGYVCKTPELLTKRKIILIKHSFHSAFINNES